MEKTNPTLPPKPPQSDKQPESRPHIPYKQIRALYDEDTITVYMAFSSKIAIPAVQEQNLSASPDFRMDRMTWMKPSWCWMMYRSNYSHKDPNQAHILALKIPHQHFQHILSIATLSSPPQKPSPQNHPHPRQNPPHPPHNPPPRPPPVLIQWDPERTPTLRPLPYRSIQIGLAKHVKAQFVKEWIVGIEDVTLVARDLKRVVEGEGEEREGWEKREGWEEREGWEDLVRRGLVPREREYEVGGVVRGELGMD